MEGFVRQLRLASRSLARSPGFTLPALAILAIGMTAATAVFTVVDPIVFRPLDYPDSERIVLLCEDHPRMGGACVASPGNVEDLGAASRTLEELGFGRTWQYVLDDGEGPRGVFGGLATAGFFRALGVAPELGRLFADGEAGPGRDDVAVLSHGLWTRRYGADPAVLGRTVRLDGEPATIVGVLPAWFEAPLDLAGVELWRPPHFEPLDPERRGWRGFRAVGRLAAGASPEAAAAELAGIYAALGEVHAEIDAEWRLLTVGLLDRVVGSARPVLLAFLGAAGLLLLIVCANVANLLLVRGLGRRRELALRAALGAGRARLVGGILTESLALAGVATLLALLFASGGTRILLALAPPDIPRLDEVAMDGRVFAFAALASLVATAVFALLPALRVTSWNLAGTLKAGSGDRVAASSGRVRSGLVVVEVALSVVLVATSALLTRSFVGYLEWDPGFDREGLLTVSAFMSPGRYPRGSDLPPFYREAEAALAAVPGVAGVGSASAGPLFGGGDGATPFATEAWDGTAALPSAEWFDAGPGYLETLGLTIVDGRGFSEDDVAGAPPVAVVNEALARMAWPGERAVGRTLRLPDRDASVEVVGVVADVPPLTPGEAARPQLHLPNRQLPRWGTFFVVRAAGDPSELAGPVVDALQGLDPELSLGTPRTLAAAEGRALVRPRFQALVLLAFAVAGLVLAAVGVYAVVSYAVAQRVREMGIRMALGAASLDVLGLVLGRSLRTAVLGVLLGVGGTFAAGRAVAGIVHGVGPRDPASVTLAALLLLLAATLAAWIPARRATRADPLAAIRTE